MSRALLGRPACVPRDMRRAQMSAASSLKANTRPRKSAWGPSGPLNHSSSSLRFFPDGFSKMPRYISPRLKEQMNRSSSTCLAIHSVSGWDGRGFVALLIMLVSRRYRVIDLFFCPYQTDARSSARRQPAVNDEELPKCHLFLPWVYGK